MKKIAIYIYFMFFIFIASSAASEALSVEQIRSNGILRVGMDELTWGYFCIWQDGRITGFDPDLANKIADEIGVKLEIIPVPWGKGEPGSITGTWMLGDWSRFDMALSAITILKERAEKVKFSEWYFSAGQMVITRKDLGIKRLEGLDGRAIGVKGETTNELAARKKFFKSRIEVYASWDDVEAALLKGEIDAAVIDNSVAYKTAKEHNNIIVLPYMLSKEFYGVVMPMKTDEGLVALVNTVIRRERHRLFKLWFE